MFNIFRKKPKNDSRDIEQVIFDVAEYNKDEDYHRLYELLIDRALFLPVDPESIPKGHEPGSRIVTDPSMQIRVRYVQGPNGETLVPCATLETAPMVRAGYIGMDWFEYLEMVLRVPSASGALIQGKTSWVGFDQERIQYILSKYSV